MADNSEIVKVIMWTVDKFLQLLGMDYQTGKDRFEKIFSPTFFDMENIHKNYSDMIEKVLLLVPNNSSEENYAWITELDKDLKPINYAIKVEIGSFKYLENLRIARELVSKERELNNHLRIESRKFSVDIVKKAHNKFEKRFCWSIINYFLEKIPFKNKDEEEAFLSRLELQGYHQEIDTPSSLIKQKFLEQKDTHKINLYIMGVKHDLNDRFLDVVHAYGELKRNTYK